MDCRLTFGWVASKEKIGINSESPAEIHLESARVYLESNQNMWGSVKSVLINKELLFDQTKWYSTQKKRVFQMAYLKFCENNY